MNDKAKSRLSTAFSVTGTILVLAAYALVSMQRVGGDDPVYQWMNLIGVILIGQEMWRKRAWGGLTLQMAWELFLSSRLRRSFSEKQSCSAGPVRFAQRCNTANVEIRRGG